MNNLIVEIFERKKNNLSPLPNKFLANEFIEKLFNLLYVNGTDDYRSAEELESKFIPLEELFYKLLLPGVSKEEEVRTLWAEFYDQLPLIYSNSLLDAKAILEFDPAAESLDEVLQAYPGFYAIAV